MEGLNLLKDNWQLITLLFGSASGGGWVGYLLSSKSRKIDLQRKVFQLSSEMIDSLQGDFADRIKNLQEYINELDAIITSQKDIISKQKEVIKGYRKDLTNYVNKYGHLDENKVTSNN